MTNCINCKLKDYCIPDECTGYIDKNSVTLKDTQHTTEHVVESELN